MKKRTVFLVIGVLFVGVLVAGLALDLGKAPAVAGEQMSTAEGNVKVLLDNDQVRVVEATRQPGTMVPMHTHPKFVAYYFSAATVRLTSPDGKAAVKDIPAGKLLWFPNGLTHSLEVMGTADQHVLVIEMKK